MNKDELSTKFLFEKLLEREDKMLAITKELNVNIGGLKDVIIEHNNISKNHNEDVEKAHRALEKTVKEIKGADRSLINSLFKVAFTIFVILAIGVEFIGRENIAVFLKALLHIQ